MDNSYISINMGDGDSQHNADHARTPLFNGVNILDWINAPKKFSKGMNIEAHIRSVKRFIEQIGAPKSYAMAILTNLLEEDCQLELFSHPEFEEGEDNIKVTISLLRKIFVEPKTEISNLVILLGERQESNESVTNFLSRIRVKAYKLMGVCDKEQKEQYILSAFINGLKDKRIAKAVELTKPTDTESALFVAKREESKQGKNSELTCFSLSKSEDESTRGLMKEMSLQIKFVRASDALNKFD